MSSIRTKFVISGDFNSKHRFWNCARRNKAGRILFDEMSKGHFVINFPDSHTYFPPQANRTTTSTVDVFLTNGYNDISDVRAINDLPSDHLPVCFGLDFCSSFKSPPPPSRRCYSKANWLLYKGYINDNLDLRQVFELDTRSKIDNAIGNLAVVIKESERLAIPFFKQRKIQPTIDNATKDLISLRNCKRRQYQRNGNPALKGEINFLNRQIKSSIKSFNNERWNAKLSQLKPHSNQL